MEKNDYIRTDLGEIAIVTDVAKETLQDILGNVEGLNQEIGFCNTEPYVKGNIIKSSKNIIDLIDNKDILKVKTKENAILMIGFDENTIDIKYKEIIEEIENGEYELLEILTHEQYERNCYVVEEEE